MIPAHAHLHGDRDRYRIHGSLDQAGRKREVSHKRAAGIAVDDLLDRASHVDVDDGRTAIPR